MKKSVCLYFQVHQPTRLRLYRFFDIGKESHYYDDYTNRNILKRIAQKCYLPMNDLLLKAIKDYEGSFRVAFSISGSALEQFERYAPEVLDSFRELSATGCVEFLSETYNHSLASIGSPEEFSQQVLKHKKAIQQYFDVTPTAFRNTELIYSDAIGKMAFALGFRTVLTEGARHMLGQRSPNYLYNNDICEKQKILLRDYALSDDIAFRFSNTAWCEHPLTSEKFAAWMKAKEGEVFNLFMDYETFGEHQSASSGIFDFMAALPKAVLDAGMTFLTPSEIASKHKAIDVLSVPDTISWADEERDLTAWLGNELQKDAFKKLYQLQEKLSILDDAALWADYGHLQESDHLYYMCTKFFSDGEVHQRFNPYNTPYEAFINYMNVLSDFIIRVNNAIAEKQ